MIARKKREHDDRSFARVSLLPKTNGFFNLPGISYWLYATNKIPNEKNVCRNAYIRKAFRRNESAHVPALDKKKCRSKILIINFWDLIILKQ